MGKNKICLVSLFVLIAIGIAASPVIAEETMSAAKRKLLEKMKKEGRDKIPETVKTEKKTGLLDLNKASKEELMTLPGISEEDADRIIAARPISSKMQLHDKGIISKEQFYGINSKVFVDISVKKWSPPPAAAKTNLPAVKSDAPKRNIFKETFN